jgi:filamentous hemagglutinin family protein
MKKPHREHDRFIRPLIFGLSLFLAIPCSFSLAQAVTPITSSGLNTQIGAPTILPGGQTVYDITGGTRPGNGPNLFHSFGDFNVPNHNIANFLNDSGLATSNILGRVTGGNISNIFGTIQTTGFGNANLFLMNPAGFLFGPTATVNVGGMMTFTSANYLKLVDGVRFNAIPNASADALLSAAPVAAFGFLGSNPGAITVQGSQLTVAEGTGISLVGGNITMQSGTLDNGTVQSAQLSAPSGQINLVSVGKPSKGGGEVVVAGSGAGPGFTPTGFRSLGTINLTQGSTVDSSVSFPQQGTGGDVVIRGGQFVMDNSSIKTANDSFFGPSGNVVVTADQIALSNGSQIDTFAVNGAGGNITFNANTFSATDSAILAGLSFPGAPPSGDVTIQGLQGSGTNAHAVAITNSQLRSDSDMVAGAITIRGDNIVLQQTTLSASPGESSPGGPITLVSRGGLNIQDSNFSTESDFGNAGTVTLQAGTSLNLTGTIINAIGNAGGSVTMVAPTISLRGSTVDVTGFGFFGGFAGTISLTGKNAVSLTNGTILTANGFPGGGTIQINGGALFTSQQSTISAQALPISCVPACVSNGNGGTIQVEANKVGLTDTQLTTSVSGGPQSVGGTITLDAKNTTLTNSQILSTATEGHGGAINITSHVLHQHAISVIDASSQSGTDGTVTINGIIQP